MRDRLVIGGSVQRPVTRFEPPFDGSFAEPRLREMMGDDLWLDLSHCPESIAQGLGNAPVQHLPPTLEQVLVRDLLHQRVLESIDGFWRSPRRKTSSACSSCASASFNAVSSRPTNARSRE